MPTDDQPGHRRHAAITDSDSSPGFGCALTAPEADPVPGSYLPKHSLATPAGERMGGVWVIPSMRIRCSTGQTGPVPASAQVSDLRTGTITASETA
jgi:hypothetical protein